MVLRRFGGFDTVDIGPGVASRARGPILRLLVAVVVIAAVANSVFVVRPSEVGVVRRFGEVVRIVEPGPHLKAPWPIEVVDRPRVQERKRLEIGFRTIFRGPPPEYRTVPAEALMLTGDENIVSAEVIVQYKIADPEAYLFNVESPEVVLKAAAEAALRQVVGSSAIDEVLTTGKDRIQAETRELLQSIIDAYGGGLFVAEVQLQDVNPPDAVVAAFKDVASAREDRNRLINQAQGYANEVIPKARGEAQKMLLEAEAYREARIARAKGEAARFEALLAEYAKAPEVTRERLLIETMEEVLPGCRVRIIDSGLGGESLRVLPVAPGALPAQEAGK